MEDQIVRLNVGGKHFETTALTFPISDPNLSHLFIDKDPSKRDQTVRFIDRDPNLFSLLLSLLRSKSLLSPPPFIKKPTHYGLDSPSINEPTHYGLQSNFSFQSLVKEATHYGIESHLRSIMAPCPLVGYDAVLKDRIAPVSDGFVTSFSTRPDGSVWLAHGGQISSYDWSLSYRESLRTHLDCITALKRINNQVGAVGSVDSPGLHVYKLDGGSGTHLGTVRWNDRSDPRAHKAHVTAIDSYHSYEEGEANVGPLFAAFECQHKENCLLSIDPTTLQITAEIGRQTGNAAKSTAPNRIIHLQNPNVLFVSSVTGGAFGYSGYMRLWDPRSGDSVWETSEPGGTTRNSSRFGDSFSDVDCDRDQMGLYKVCSKSGDVGVADLRKLGNDPWVYLSDGINSGDVNGGENSVICCYKKQVFVSKESGLEVWSQLGSNESESKSDVCMRRYRRNFVDKKEDLKRGMINGIEAAGERLFLTREGMEGIEVWESERLSRAVSLR